MKIKGSLEFYCMFLGHSVWKCSNGTKNIISTLLCLTFLASKESLSTSYEGGFTTGRNWKKIYNYFSFLLFPKERNQAAK